MEENKQEIIRVDGIGILIKKLDRMIELQDRTNFLLSMIEKKMTSSHTLKGGVS